MRRYDATIIGAGHGGAQAAIQLRQLGFQGSIALIGAEPDLPYDRPPLSKDYLAGEKDFGRMLIRPRDFWTEREIHLHQSKIVAVDAGSKILTADNDETFGYGALIWAAGGVPRRLRCAGGDLGGVHVVRCKADVDRIKAELDGVRRVAIVGGGFIGLEVAAVLSATGRQITVVEALDRVLARVAAPEISHFYQAEHRAHGIDIRLGRTVERIEGASGRMTGIRLANDEIVEAEMAIVGIGIAPAAEPLIAAGAAHGDGIHVDAACRTSLDDVYAIGDCAAQRNRFAGGERIRLESVQNAHDQAMAAARAVLGHPDAETALPWFWSNQYDLRLQTIGLSIGYDRTILRGRPEERSFSLIYLREGRVIALDCVNAVRDYAQGRKLVADGIRADPVRLADPAVPLKQLTG